MEAKSSKTQNQPALAEGLALVATFMIILIVKANTPIQEFFLGVLVGMWVAAVMAFLGAVGKTYVWKRR